MDRYLISASTASGGRPMAALLPDTATGRCSRMGCRAIALAMSALPVGLLLAERLELRLAVADQLARSPPTRPISVSTSALLGGCLRYSRIAGSTPFWRRSSRAWRDLLQRGLCQT